MANEEHVRMLKLSVEVWNKWRKENPGIRPDLFGADLCGQELFSMHLAKKLFSGMGFSKGAPIRDPLKEFLNTLDSLEDPVRTNLSQADLSQADLRRAFLTGADLSGADLSGANLSGASLSGADLSNADLSNAELGIAYFSIGSGKVGGGSDVVRLRVNLEGANLSGANLTKTNLSETNLSRSSLHKANLYDAVLTQADLSGADLSQADLRNAILRGADFRGADINESRIGFTSFDNVDLSEVKGLDTVRHAGPSTIGIDTVYKSKGNIPEVFLRGTGVPDTLITFMKSLTGAAIDFYSCFISYSTKDQAFTERLYADLQAKGVRCWYAPHDIQGGKKIHEQIDQAIRLHDKLLLVLSEHSMDSEWVKTEVYNARQQEAKENKRKLFPISLTEYEQVRQWRAFDADIGKDMAREVREYYIPDFTHWKDHDAYQQAFERLMRDLKAEG